ncbi:MAG: hypothetical protein AAGB93_21270, partial [Planctomycetota bacterium]
MTDTSPTRFAHHALAASVCAVLACAVAACTGPRENAGPPGGGADARGDREGSVPGSERDRGPFGAGGGGSTPRAPGDSAAAEAYGALRHAQLLSVDRPDALSPGLVRFATASRGSGSSSRISIHEVPIAASARPANAVSIGSPVLSIAFPFDVLPGWSWTIRERWRLVESEDTLLLVTHDQRSRSVELRDVTSGRRLFDLEGCESLEDVRYRDGTIELVVRSTGGIRVLSLSPSGAVRSSRTIDLLDVTGARAALVRSPSARQGPTRLALVGWRAQRLVVAVHDLATQETRTLDIGVDGASGPRARIAAWARGDLVRIAVGLPDDAGGRGRMLLVQADEGGDGGLLHATLPYVGEPPPAVDAEDPASVDAQGYGQAVRFTADLDGD